MMDKPEKIRLINLGTADWFLTQTVYHAVAELLTEDSPDTIIICRPDQRYLCAGYHQDYKSVFGLTYCRQNDIPIIHRKIGGGATYLDSNQLFYQFVFKQKSVPKSFSEIFSYLLEVPKNALNKLGVACALTSTNELEVDNKRIAGTGGGFINEACVVVGNFLFDFDFDTMAHVWNLPLESSRQIAKSAMKSSMITLSQLNTEITFQIVEEKFVEAVGKKFNCEIYTGLLSEEEKSLALKMKDGLVADPNEFEQAKSCFIEKPLKISANSSVLYETFKINGNEVQFAFYTNQRKVVDFVTEPNISSLPKLKKLIVGKDINEVRSALSFFQMKFRHVLS